MDGYDHIEWHKSDKDKFVWYHLRVKSKQMDLFTEQKETHRHRKLMVAKGKKEGEG